MGKTHLEASFFHQSEAEVSKIKQNTPKRHRGGKQSSYTAHLKQGNSEKLDRGQGRSARPYCRRMVQHQVAVMTPDLHQGGRSYLDIAKKLEGPPADEWFFGYSIEKVAPEEMVVDLLEIAVPARKRGLRKQYHFIPPLEEIIAADSEDELDWEFAGSVIWSESAGGFDEWETLDDDLYESPPHHEPEKMKPRLSYADTLKR